MGETWDQQTGESGEAFAAFKAFRDLGPARTLAEAYRSSRPGKGPQQAHAGPTKKPGTPGTWKTWAIKYRWKERAAAFDARGAQVQQAAAEKVIAAVAADRAAMMLEQERREHQLAGLIHGKLLEMLEQGLVKRKVVKTDDGKTITITEPAKWDFGTAAKLAQVFTALGRVSLNMPVKVDPKESGGEPPYFETSGEQESALPAGAVPDMPAESAAKPELGVSAIGPAGEGLKQPQKARPPRANPGNL